MAEEEIKKETENIQEEVETTPSEEETIQENIEQESETLDTNEESSKTIDTHEDESLLTEEQESEEIVSDEPEMTEEEIKALAKEKARLRKVREEEEYFQNYVYKKVEFIKFGILSPKMIQKMSAAKVITPELYDSEGYPVDGGLMDTRMGVIDPGLRCKTCGQKLKNCPGHFGYIELARPVVHINFISEILDLLRCTCKMCGRILLKKETIKKHRDELDTLEEEFGLLARRSMIKEIIKKLKTAKKCPHCQATQGKIMLEKPSSFVEDEKRINPIEARARLEKIPDEDLRIFGFDPIAIRPEWMILTIMPIPPVTIRPSITLESGERSEDDLTHKLGDIVRINQRLFENINAGAPEIIIEDLWDLLQYHVTTFFDNNVAQIPPARHRSGQPLKTLSGRIKSKEGRIRHNLAGRRTNFSARSVISPDPNLELNEVGVPLKMAMKLTVPERITDWNKEYLIEYINKGPKEYPGANYVITPAGRKKRITEETREEILAELDNQYIVERHLIDGDIALFNRQPSLHRMSMMCHKIRVLPHKTFRINPCVCKPYNADFDGDEMNLHIPQTEEARAEAQILMQVQTQLVSPRYGKNIIGAMQGSVTGCYILTKYLTLSRKDAITILNAIGVFDTSNLPNKEKVSGNEIVSSILPKDFNFKSKTKKGDELLIKNGKIESGFIDNNAIGDDGNGYMLRILHKKYGPDKTITIIGKIFRLGLEVLLRNGFTVSISDTDLTPEISSQVEDILSKAEKDIDKLIKSFDENKLEIIPGKSIEETLELRIMERLNHARNDSGETVIKSMDKTIPLITMADCGSRGNVINIAQMSACVGQQALRGKRITLGYKERTLSCFNRNDLSPKAHGFIRNSFKTGLQPYEFFFAAMTGRDSLMDTALRTPKSGYLYRRLSNALQDLKVEYDGTVRDSSNNIIQFKYGDDGIDVSKSEKGRINVQRIIENLE